ncbi:MAG: hypothetical protein IJM85_01210 [Clostridia bacterium]|nr:hypothetical protein [Clostridia bacterium]
MKGKGKKGYRLIRLFSLLLAVLLICGCAGTARHEKAAEKRIANAPITDSSHEREAGYPAAFSTRMLSLGRLTVHMEARLFDEDLLLDCAGAIRDDLARLESVSGEAPGEVTVYIAGSTLDGAPTAVGSRVFCTLEDAESGACREALAEAAYGLEAVWQGVGLADYVFNREAAGVDLNDYYSRAENALTASCSALHLSPVLADEGTLRAARATARSLTAFLLESGGFASFRAAVDPASVLGPWAERLGLSAPPTLPENSAAAAALRLGTERNCLSVLKLNALTVKVHEDSFVREPDALYLWLCDYLAGMDTVLALIREEAPSAAETAERRFSEPISITLENEADWSYTDPSRGEVFISGPEDAWHETLHLLLAAPDEAVFAWQCEGVAEHFSYRADTIFAPEHYVTDGMDAYLSFFEEVSGREANEADMAFHTSVLALYDALRDPELTDKDDQGAYFRAYGIASLLLDGVTERSQERVKYDASVAYKRGVRCGAKSEDGNALSYPEAAVMFEYLAGKYGTDAVLAAYLDGVRLEEAFGISYPQLYAGARAYYAGLYRDLMAAELTY